MADRMTQREHDVTSPDRDVFECSGYWAIGATGAVGAQTKATGLSLARSDVGTYTLSLKNGANAAYAPFIHYAHVEVVTSDADPTNDTAAIQARVTAFSASSGTVSFQTFDEAGVAADPASGAVLMACVKTGQS